MKKNKDILLRGGHKLKYISGDLWEFVPRESWCPIQVTLTEDHGYSSIDSDGMGMPLLIGCQVADYKIVSMFDDPDNEKKILVGMKPLHKKSTQDLEKGDIIYEVINLYDGMEVKEHIVKSIEDDNKRSAYVFVECEDKTFTIDRKNAYGMLDSTYGVMTVSFVGGVQICIFTNKEYAKKHAYDIIQDQIESLKETQRKIMKL